MSIADHLNSLGRRFDGRLPAAHIELALGYVDLGEEPLALETLCDYLCDHVVPLSPDEFSEVMRLNQSMNPRLSARMVQNLQSLVGL